VTPDVEKIEQLGIQTVPAKLLSKEDLVRHNPQKLAQVSHVAGLPADAFLAKGLSFLTICLCARRCVNCARKIFITGSSD
jgi:hypothetical protein